MTLRKQIILIAILGPAAGFACFCYCYPLVKVSGYCLVVDGVTVGNGAASVHADTADVNFFRQPLQDYAEALLAEYPEFASVNCRMGLRGEVICDGVRKKPIAVVSMPEVFGMSERGELLPLNLCDVGHPLPLITGIKPQQAEAYSLVSSAKLREAVKICRILSSGYSRIRAELSQIDLASCDSPVMYFRDSNIRVIVGYGDYRQKLHNLNLILDKLRTLPAGELDLRFGRSIVVRDLT